MQYDVAAQCTAQNLRHRYLVDISQAGCRSCYLTLIGQRHGQESYRPISMSIVIVCYQGKPDSTRSSVV